MDTPKFSHLTSIDFKHIYEPAEDSFLLLDALEKDLENLKSEQPTFCVELGPGSGILIAAIAKYIPQTFCIGVDVSPYACRASQSTAKENGVGVDLVNMNLLHGIRANSIDLLIFNPPYVPSRLEESEDFETGVKESSQSIVQTWAGGINGREIIDKFLKDLQRVMAPKGTVYLLLLKENDPNQIVEQMQNSGFQAEIFMERRILGEYLFVVKIRKSI